MADGGSKRKLNADSVSPEANQAKKHQGGSPPINGGDAFASLPGAQCPHCGEACLSENDETGTCSSLEEMMKGGELGMDKKFASLSKVVSEKTLNAVTDMGYTDMMEIQHKSIRPLLDGKHWGGGDFTN